MHTRGKLAAGNRLSVANAAPASCCTERPWCLSIHLRWVPTADTAREKTCSQTDRHTHTDQPSRACARVNNFAFSLAGILNPFQVLYAYQSYNTLIIMQVIATKSIHIGLELMNFLHGFLLGRISSLTVSVLLSSVLTN